MANTKLGAALADARGSIGGLCLSRGGGGSTARTNPKPVNPRSVAQNTQRAHLAYLTQRWGKTLTEPQRTAWRDYAAGTSWTNRVGTSATISGIAAYLRLNSLLLQSGNTVQDTAPTLLGHAGQATFTFTAADTALAIAIAQPAEPFDKNITGHKMIFFVHGPTNPGRLSPGPGKRYLGTVTGNNATPPTFPLTLTSPINYYLGQRVTVTGIFIDAVGRIGGAYQAQVLATHPS